VDFLSLHNPVVQDISRKILHLQNETTLLNLKIIQLASNKAALTALIDERSAAYQETLNLYQAGGWMFGWYTTVLTCVTTSNKGLQHFESGDICQKPRMSNEAGWGWGWNSRSRCRDEYCKSADKHAWLPPYISMQEDFAATHTSDDLSKELVDQQQRLDLILEANPGAVEQYERRKAEVKLPKLFHDYGL
jgi:structural maintenance of chromosomes protein 5